MMQRVRTGMRKKRSRRDRAALETSPPRNTTQHRYSSSSSSSAPSPPPGSSSSSRPFLQSAAKRSRRGQLLDQQQQQDVVYRAGDNRGRMQRGMYDAAGMSSWSAPQRRRTLEDSQFAHVDVVAPFPLEVLDLGEGNALRRPEALHARVTESGCAIVVSQQSITVWSGLSAGEGCITLPLPTLGEGLLPEGMASAADRVVPVLDDVGSLEAVFYVSAGGMALFWEAPDEHATSRSVDYAKVRGGRGEGAIPLTLQLPLGTTTAQTTGLQQQQQEYCVHVKPISRDGGIFVCGTSWGRIFLVSIFAEVPAEEGTSGAEEGDTQFVVQPSISVMEARPLAGVLMPDDSRTVTGTNAYSGHDAGEGVFSAVSRAISGWLGSSSRTSSDSAAAAAGGSAATMSSASDVATRAYIDRATSRMHDEFRDRPTGSVRAIVPFVIQRHGSRLQSGVLAAGTAAFDHHSVMRDFVGRGSVKLAANSTARNTGPLAEMHVVWVLTDKSLSLWYIPPGLTSMYHLLWRDSLRALEERVAAQCGGISELTFVDVAVSSQEVVVLMRALVDSDYTERFFLGVCRVHAEDIVAVIDMTDRAVDQLMQADEGVDVRNCLDSIPELQQPVRVMRVCALPTPEYGVPLWFHDRSRVFLTEMDCGVSAYAYTSPDMIVVSSGDAVVPTTEKHVPLCYCLSLEGRVIFGGGVAVCGNTAMFLAMASGYGLVEVARKQQLERSTGAMAALKSDYARRRSAADGAGSKFSPKSKRGRENGPSGLASARVASVPSGAVSTIIGGSVSAGGESTSRLVASPSSGSALRPSTSRITVVSAQVNAAFQYFQAGELQNAEACLQNVTVEVFNKHLQEVVVSLARRIADSRPFSGRIANVRRAWQQRRIHRGADEENTYADAIMTQRMQEKLEKIMDLLAFLVQFNLWTLLSYASQVELLGIGEKICAVHNLRAEMMDIMGGVQMASGDMAGMDILSAERMMQFGVPTDRIVVQRALMNRLVVTLTEKRAHGHLMQEGFNFDDIFYSHVTLVGDVWLSLHELMRETLSNRVECDNHVRCTVSVAIGAVIEALLSPMNQHREDVIARFGGANDFSVASLAPDSVGQVLWRWTLTSEVKACLRLHMDIIERDLLATKESSADALWQHLYAWCFRISGMFLGEIESLLSHMETLLTYSDSLRDETREAIDAARNQLLAEYMVEREKLVRKLASLAVDASESITSSKETAVDMQSVYEFTEAHDDFKSLVRLCFEEMDRAEKRESVSPPSALPLGSVRLWSYLNRYGRDFAEALFSFCLEGERRCRKASPANIARLLHMAPLPGKDPRAAANSDLLLSSRAHVRSNMSSSDFNVWLRARLTAIPSISWLHHLRLREFGSAASVLSIQASGTNRVGIKRHLMSMSKLAMVAMCLGEPAPNSVHTVARGKADIGAGCFIHDTRLAKVKSHAEIQRLNDELDILEANAFVHGGSLQESDDAASLTVDELVVVLLDHAFEPHTQRMDAIRCFLLGVDVVHKGTVARLLRSQQDDVSQQETLARADSLVRFLWLRAVALDEDLWLRALSACAPDGMGVLKDLVSSSCLFHICVHLASIDYYGCRQVYAEALNNALSVKAVELDVEQLQLRPGGKRTTSCSLSGALATDEMEKLLRDVVSLAVRSAGAVP